MKIFLYMLGLLFLLTSCGREEPEITPWPYELVELTQNAGEDNEFRIPAWFDPATGETAAVCGETSHGEGCLFWSESYYDPNFIPWRDTLFWGKKTADGYVLAAYSTESGTERTVCKIRHPSNFRVVGDYLCVGNSMELTHRMYLPDWREDTSPAGSMPDSVDGDTAYYLIRGARGRDGGIYRQNLYETGERPPVKELLFADAVVRDCRYDGDAVFWTGNSSLYEEGVHLYRYDLRTREYTVLLANFEKWVFPVSGDWLYYADKTSLQKIHKETGEVRLACQTDSVTLNTGANGIREVGGTISVQAHDGENTGRLVYYPKTGEAVFYPVTE